ncbi:glycosyltransferase [Flavobacterium ginsengiterrae]|uniref:Glycosyltransferase 2-like domain-containing protein n=1 Tax=Flavobacterium ginsengiterrae TaxID=871695 RepID=A0ABP7H0S1_9FLAO
MLTIIYPYRNRELERIKNSLNSLLSQSNMDFEVIFVDYGSQLEISKEVKELLSEYKFVEYVYSYNIYQPWSRSKAINIGLQFTKTEYVFIADIDIFFHPNFIDKLYSLKQENTNYYFQVGYLNKQESLLKKEFNDYKIESKSIAEGKGLSFFKLNSLLSINGFDEFFHFWGAEDQDIHQRLQNNGNKEIFYNKEILLLHQWHPTFESLQKNKLTVEPLIEDAFNLNKQKLRFNRENNLIIANIDCWGLLFTREAFDMLESEDGFVEIINKKNNVDYFLNVVLSNFTDKIKVRFITDAYQKSLKYKIKKRLKIEKNEYYSLKYINDTILLNIILHHKSLPYIFKVNSDFESLDFIMSK